jgi:uncharacterized protein (TIGR02466 family)
MIIKDIFRTPILYTNLKNKKFETHARKLLFDAKKNNKLNIVSNVGGIQTNIFEGSQMINKVFEQPISEFIYSFKRKKDIAWTIKSFWINENKIADFNKPHEHIHPELHFAAVWYIDAPENCGKLVFLNSSKGIDFCSSFDFFDDPMVFAYFEHQPIPGDFIIFPSNLTHYVEPSKSKKTRLSLAMNIGITSI